jgi:hypothetical protein
MFALAFACSKDLEACDGMSKPCPHVLECSASEAMGGDDQNQRTYCESWLPTDTTVLRGNNFSEPTAVI